MKFNYIFPVVPLWWLVISHSVGQHIPPTPQKAMVEITNDFGVCILQLVHSRTENVAFSPYGLVSVALVLYEGTRGPTAAEIHATLKLPWNREVTRVGFRDLHRYLKSYFTNDGFLRGLVLSKPNVPLRQDYLRLLRFYGFYTNIMGTSTPESSTTQTTITIPFTTTHKPQTTTESPPEERTTTEIEAPTMTTREAEVATTVGAITEVATETSIVTTTESVQTETSAPLGMPEIMSQVNETASSSLEDGGDDTNQIVNVIPTTDSGEQTERPEVINLTTTELHMTTVTDKMTSGLPSSAPTPATGTTNAITTSGILTTAEHEAAPDSQQQMTAAAEADRGTTVGPDQEATTPAHLVATVTTPINSPTKPVTQTEGSASSAAEELQGSGGTTTVSPIKITDSTKFTTDAITVTTEVNMTETVSTKKETMAESTILPTSSAFSTTGSMAETTSINVTPFSSSALTVEPQQTSSTTDSMSTSSTLPLTTPPTLYQTTESSSVPTSSEKPTEPTTLTPQSGTTLDSTTSQSSASSAQLGGTTEMELTTTTPGSPLSSTAPQISFSESVPTVSVDISPGLSTTEEHIAAPDSQLHVTATAGSTTFVEGPTSSTSEMTTMSTESATDISSSNKTPASEVATTEGQVPAIDSQQQTTTISVTTTPVASDSTTSEAFMTHAASSTAGSSSPSEEQVVATGSQQQVTVESKATSQAQETTGPMTQGSTVTSSSTVIPETSGQESSDLTATTPGVGTSTASTTQLSSSNVTDERQELSTPTEGATSEGVSKSTTSANILDISQQVSSSTLEVTQEATSTEQDSTTNDQPVVNAMTQESTFRPTRPPDASSQTAEGPREDSTLEPTVSVDEMSTPKAVPDISSSSQVDAIFLPTTSTEGGNTLSSTPRPGTTVQTESSGSTQTPVEEDMLAQPSEIINGTILAPTTRRLSARRPRSIDSEGDEDRGGSGVANWIMRSQHGGGARWVPSPAHHWFFTFTGPGESVPVLTYTAYLPFAHVPEISSLALQIPLDDPRYTMLILLPEERLGLEELLYSLQWCQLTNVLAAMKVTPVYAVVPSFTTVKHVNLGPALAQLGVRRVFDPYRADLSEMSPEPHVFVRTVEQVVTVSLRKYYHNHRWFDARPHEIRHHFVADHPFAYFVLDKETGVALMAGTVVNPITKQTGSP